MALPNPSDPSGDYGMPAGGFADYVESPTDPTTDWPSGNPPGQTNTGGPGGNQLIIDVAAMTRTARRCWVRFTLGTSPALAPTNQFDAMWGTGTAPTLAHTGTGTWTITWPATYVDKLGQTRTLNLRWARPSIEGATAAAPPQASVTSPNVITLYGFNTSFAANDLSSSYTVLVEAG